MFQNIVTEEEENSTQEELQTDKKVKLKEILSKLFTKQNILVYIISFMLSMVSGINGIAPFALAIFAAALSNMVPASVIYLVTMIGTAIGFGRTRGIDIYSNISCFYCYDTNI